MVVYDHEGGAWSTRLWWNFRLEGFDRVSVLDGGFDAWDRAGLASETGTAVRVPAQFTARRRPELYADSAQVLAGLGDPDVVLLNPLSEKDFRGERQQYARPGRIPGSHRLGFEHLINPDGTSRDTETVRALADATGALDPDKTPIAYCGGGIGASFVAFQLARLGRPYVAVYDGSLTEWAADPTLPLEIG